MLAWRDKTKYEIVKYRPEFKSQVLELQTYLWSPDLDVNTAYLEWKYEQNPYLSAPLIYVALCAGKVVGMRGMYGAKWQIGNSGQTFLCPCAGDLVIFPDHRNQGLFTKIMRTALDDLAGMNYNYVFNLSSSPVTRLSSLTTGWRSVGRFPTLLWRAGHRVIPHRLQRNATRRPVFSSPQKQDPFYFLDQNAAKREHKISPRISVEQTPRPEAMAELTERTVNDERIRHVRDQKYFAWRFNNPLSRYRFLYYEGSRLDGYLILQTKFNNTTLRVNIADWEATNLQTRSELLEAALHLGNFDAISIWTATLPDGVQDLLEENGFKVLSEKKGIEQSRRTILVRPVRDDMLKTDWIIADIRLLELANWDLRRIYSDVD